METVLEKVPETRDEMVAGLLSNDSVCKDACQEIIAWYDKLIHEGELQGAVELAVYNNAWENLSDPVFANCNVEHEVYQGIVRIENEHMPPCKALFQKPMRNNKDEWTLILQSEDGKETYLEQVFSVGLSLTHGHIEVSLTPIY